MSWLPNDEWYKDLFDKCKTKKEVDKVEADVPALAGTTNNNVFIGSTAELQKMLRDEAVIDVEPDLFKDE